MLFFDNSIIPEITERHQDGWITYYPNFYPNDMSSIKLEHGELEHDRTSEIRNFTTC